MDDELLQLATNHNQSTHAQNLGITYDIAYSWMNNCEEFLIALFAFRWAIGNDFFKWTPIYDNNYSI